MGHRVYLIAVLFILLTGCIHQPTQPISPLSFVSPLRDVPLPQSKRLLLPIVRSPLSGDASCFGNPKALSFYQLLKSDPRQQRPELHCNVALVKAAQKRANGLAGGDPWAHYDRFGVWANQYARDAGCQLPDDYNNRNQIESLTAGLVDVDKAFYSLTHDGAPDHRRHLFAETEFFRRQMDVGIGYSEGGVYGFYWVVMIAPCRE